ncbi:MAG: HAMP domain-containing protein [Cohaesibacteraceae bacterium]|nr:HAMP domain-containing protein [Cohaesibacteraceae bacterium]
MMSTFGKLIRTTAFKLSIIYLVIFSLFAVGMISYIAYSTQSILGKSLNESITREVTGLGRIYQQGGVRRLANEIERKSRHPGASLYLLLDFSGRILAGNVAELENGALDIEGAARRPIKYKRYGDSEQKYYRAVVNVFDLPGGFRVLVGRDISERDHFREVIGDSLVWSAVVIIVLALISWVFVARRVLSRIDEVTLASKRIMEGQFSERLPVSGSGDEFDRLAEGLNTMLARIETLMHGLKEVSDNIAHDLKTPLTRMRNRIEAALAQEPSSENDRKVLESAIEESDGLIRTFDALLRIARVEAKATHLTFSKIDAGAIVQDLAELYEALAEDGGASLVYDIEKSLDIKGNRELIGQAISNLTDNAVKYASENFGGDGSIVKDGAKVNLSASRQGDRIQIIVADNGPGIPIEDRDHVLQRFVRLEKSRSKPGSGLGLSLVNAVAGLHDATLALEDTQPGLKVVLSFPVWNDDVVLNSGAND